MTRQIDLGIGPEALQREGLRELPEIWEDGQRVAPEPGNFEWWYFDAHFDDGSSAVVVFFTKSIIDRRSRLKPGISIAITGADGKKRSAMDMVPPEDFSASKERCYVRAGESWVRGDLCVYELHARAGELSAHLTFTGLVPAWRPGTGKHYYDEKQTRYFGWLPSIPHGTVEGYVTYDGKIRQVKGTCYHDHNWGNVGLNDVLSHWYWGRAHLGDITLIFAEMHAAPRYDKQVLPVFLLAKGDHILTGDGQPLRVVEGEFLADPSGRSYPDKLDLTWEGQEGRVQLKLRHPVVVDSFSLLDQLPAWKRVIGRLLANPYYFRFHADLDLQVDLPGSGVHVHEQGRALYELMLLR